MVILLAFITLSKIPKVFLGKEVYFRLQLRHLHEFGEWRLVQSTAVISLGKWLGEWCTRRLRPRPWLCVYKAIRRVLPAVLLWGSACQICFSRLCTWLLREKSKRTILIVLAQAQLQECSCAFWPLCNCCVLSTPRCGWTSSVSSWQSHARHFTSLWNFVYSGAKYIGCFRNDFRRYRFLKFKQLWVSLVSVIWGFLTKGSRRLKCMSMDTTDF